MKRIRWLAVACAAVAGMVLAFAAGMWLVKPAKDATAEVTPTTPKATPASPPTMLKGDYQTLSHKPDIPIRPVNDTPKMPVEVPKPAGGTPLPAIDLASLPVVPVEARPSGPPSEPLIPPIPPIVPRAEPTPPTPPATSAPKGPSVQYVNKPELEFDYDVGKKGKSGVKSVSLFVRDPAVRDQTVRDAETPRQVKVYDPNTLDAHWRPFSSADTSTGGGQKLRYTMPKEGRYEFRLGVTSGNGNASTPKDTDPADMVVVLDATPPAISRFDAEVDPATNSVAFHLDVTEINPDNAKPAMIEYRNSAAGQWQVVKLKDMNWAIPADAPAEVTFRVTVTDLAGNVATRAIDKLNLDTTIPEGKLTRVRTVEVVKNEEPQIVPPSLKLDLTPKK